MREFLKNFTLFLLSHGDWVYYATITAVVVIIAFSAVSAHRSRGSFASNKKAKPLSSLAFFLEASSRGEEADDVDYMKYREEMTRQESSEEEDALSSLEYFAETYIPKLIKGCVISLILMALVAAPYLVIEYFL